MHRSLLTFPAIAIVSFLSPSLSRAQTDSLPGRYISLPIGPKAPLGALEGDGAVQTASSPTIPLWNGSISGFNYSMVGQNPQTPLTNQTTTVAAAIIPIVFKFADGTSFDPSAGDATCLSGNDAASLTAASPIFQNFSFSAAPAYTDKTQYLDFYQRANFWQYTNPSGINPNYHVYLNATKFAAIQVPVPAGSGSVSTGGYCGGKLGKVDINWFDTYAKSTLFTQLASLGVLPSNLPIFLSQSVVMYDTNPGNCCIIGYHTAFYNSRFGNAIQTYAFAEFDSTGAFGSSNRDVAALSHEVGEWLDDPLANNPTLPWGNIGQTSGCESDLEVGDPLTGTTLPALMPNGFTYHVQELVFFSWFYNQIPSLGVNGWYSSNGTFKAPATPCGVTSTSKATLSTGTVNFGSQNVGTPGFAQSITLSSTGTTALSNIAVSLIGSNPGDFSLTNSCPTNLPTGTSCFVSVSFNPTAGGSRSAKVSFSDDATGSPQSVNLTGTGVSVAPQISISGLGYSFTSQAIGTTSPAQTTKITNIGSVPLPISSISITGSNPADFNQTNNCPASLAVNASCSISLTFTPTAQYYRSAQVTIVDGAAGSPHNIQLNGTGTPAVSGAPQVSLSANSLTFPAQAVGASASQSITLTNTGTAALTGIAISVGGPNAGDFIQSSTCSATLAAGANCSISIAFTPSIAGTRTASVSISDNVPGAPQTVSLSGTGTSTAPSLPPYLNSVSPFVVPVNKTTTLTVTGLNLQSGFSATLTSAAGGTVAIPSANLTFVNSGQVQVTITPTGVAPYAATLTITNPGGLKASSQFFVFQF